MLTCKLVHLDEHFPSSKTLSYCQLPALSKSGERNDQIMGLAKRIQYSATFLSTLDRKHRTWSAGRDTKFCTKRHT